MDEMLRILNARAEAALECDIEDDGDFFSDKLMENRVEVVVGDDIYKLIRYDETPMIYFKECWMCSLEIFEVTKNGEEFGFIGRRVDMSCCGDVKEGKFVEATPIERKCVDWIVEGSMSDEVINLW